MEFYISKGNTDVVIVRLLRAVINISGEIIRNKRLKRIIITPRGAAMNAVASKYVESRSYFLCSHHSEFAPRKKLALKIKRQIDPFVTSRLFSFPPFLQEVLSKAVSRTVNIISKWNFATIRVRHIQVHTCIKVRSDINVNFLFVHLSRHFVLCELCTFSQIRSHIQLLACYIRLQWFYLLCTDGKLRLQLTPIVKAYQKCKELFHLKLSQTTDALKCFTRARLGRRHSRWTSHVESDRCSNSKVYQCSNIKWPDHKQSITI